MGRDQMDKLTAKQSAFVEQFLVDLNATAAATRAGYSARTAKHIGSELLATPKVAAAISAAKVARSSQVSVDAAYVLVRLVAEADADIADLFDEDGALKPIKSIPLIWRQGLLAGIEVEELFEGQGDARKHVGRVTKVRFSDRVRRIELIGKHVTVKAFQEQVHITGLDDLAARLARAKKRTDDEPARLPPDPARPAPTAGAEGGSGLGRLLPWRQ